MARDPCSPIGLSEVKEVAIASLVFLACIVGGFKEKGMQCMSAVGSDNPFSKLGC